jgi:hypothetical protein
MWENYDRRQKRNRIAVTPLCCLNGLALIGLSIGLIVSSVLWSNAVSSLNQRVNAINTTNTTSTDDLLSIVLPCYGKDNPPIVPTQMQCLGDGITRPTANCDLSYTTKGPGICGLLTVTKLNGKTSVTVGFGGELVYNNSINNDNNSFQPLIPSFNSGDPFLFVTTYYRFDNYIPAPYRPPFTFDTFESAEISGAEQMITTTARILIFPNGTVDVIISFADTVPAGGNQVGWLFGGILAAWVL